MQGSRKMLETKSWWIQKKMVVLGRASNASFTMQSLLMPRMLKPQKGERIPSLDPT